MDTDLDSFGGSPLDTFSPFCLLIAVTVVAGWVDPSGGGSGGVVRKVFSVAVLVPLAVVTTTR